MRILVIDGQGGGIGRALIEKLAETLPDGNDIIAVGTNSVAATVMKKAGAIQAATGENAVLYNAARADIIVGSLGIIAANSIMGELTPAMAEAVSSSDAEKVLIPLNKCRLNIACPVEETLARQVERAAEMVRALCLKGS